MGGSVDAGRDTRWAALLLLSLGVLMTVIDSTIVTVALPSIKADLHFSDGGLGWVANAYLLAFGGSLILAGRLGDLYGARRLFLAGVLLFALASLGCGLTGRASLLIVCRTLQGLSGALINAVALALIARLFPEPERARAMAVYSCVCAGGGSFGLLLGGLLTQSVNWHWIFLINVPLGLVVVYLGRRWLPTDRPVAAAPIDLAGASLLSCALVSLVYAIVSWQGPEANLARSASALLAAALLLRLFVRRERRASAPLVPLALFRRRTLTLANTVVALWAAALFGWYFLVALLLQAARHYGALQIGLAFLPANLIVAASSLGLSARLITRFGIRAPLIGGLLIFAAGELLSALTLTGAATHALDTLLPVLLLGVGGGVAFNAMFLAAMSQAAPDEAGLAAGLVNTSFMVGGALGIALLTVIANLPQSGPDAALSVLPGYRNAFVAGGGFALLAAALVALRYRQPLIALGRVLAPADDSAARCS